MLDLERGMIGLSGGLELDRVDGHRKETSSASTSVVDRSIPKCGAHRTPNDESPRWEVEGAECDGHFRGL